MRTRNGVSNISSNSDLIFFLSPCSAIIITHVYCIMWYNGIKLTVWCKTKASSQNFGHQQLVLPFNTKNPYQLSKLLYRSIIDISTWQQWWLFVQALPKLITNISFEFHHFINTALADGSLVNWIPIKVTYTSKIWVVYCSLIGIGSNWL